MNPLAKLILIAGGLALGMIGASRTAGADLERMKAERKKQKILIKPLPRTDVRKVWNS